MKLQAVALLFALGCLAVPSGSHANVPPPSRADPPKTIKNPTAIVYVSPWCGHSGKTFRNACQRVMEELGENNVPFEVRDIFDERWRDEYVAKMESIGRRPPAVPLTDIEGYLVLGANDDVGSVATDLRKGVEPQLDEEPGYTKPPSPKKRLYQPGEKWVEPDATTAIVYGSKSCPHCRPTRKFLKKHKIKSTQRDQFDPKYQGEHQAHMKRFGRSGPSAPCVYLFGRFMIGFDDQAIEAMVHWRNTLPKEPSKSGE